MKRAGVALLLVMLWAAGLVGGTLFGWWRRPLAPRDDRSAFIRAAIRIVDAGNPANTALVLIENGAISAEYYSTHSDSIERNTVFATASLSKWITAHAVMKGRHLRPDGCTNPARSRVWDDESRQAVCGDWCQSARIEGAFLSGLAAADRVLRASGSAGNPA